MGQARAQVWGVVASEPKVTSVGQSLVYRISVASDEGYGERKITSWWSIELWVKAEHEKRINYLNNALGKGARVVAAGSPCLRTWVDKEGKEHPSLELKHAEVDIMLAAPREQDVTQPPRQAAPQQQPVLYDDEIPF